jgi:hypothetical protein
MDFMCCIFTLSLSHFYFFAPKIRKSENSKRRLLCSHFVCSHFEFKKQNYDISEIIKVRSVKDDISLESPLKSCKNQPQTLITILLWLIYDRKGENMFAFHLSHFVFFAFKILNYENTKRPFAFSIFPFLYFRIVTLLHCCIFELSHFYNL